MDKSSAINHFVNLKINGMHYVRELSCKDIDNNKNEINRITGYLIIDSNNKPVKKVFDFLIQGTLLKLILHCKVFRQ